MGFQSRMDGATLAVASEGAPFADRPWRRIDLAPMRDVVRVPTMLAPEEQQFYLWLTRDWMQGDGMVIDLGAFVGGSTARLAEGHRIAGHPGKVFGFDRFRAGEDVKARLLYPGGVPRFRGDDVFRVARRLLAPWRDRLVLRRGEIQSIGWTGDPIEVLAVDAFKRVDLIDRMVADFFPALVPGRSILVQQDFLHWSQPWICALMVRFGDAFVPLCHVPGDTVAFLLQKPLTPDRIAAARIADITDTELLQAIRLTRAVMAPWRLDARFDAMERGLLRNPDVRVAWQMPR